MGGPGCGVSAEEEEEEIGTRIQIKVATRSRVCAVAKFIPFGQAE